MATTCVGYMYIFVFLMFLSWSNVCAEDEFCEEQDELFQVCSQRMEFIYFARSQSLDVLCREIAQYLTCVHETNLSCPDMPIFQDRVYAEAIQNAMNQLTRFCKGYSITTKCTVKFVHHLVRRCTAIINKVQFDTPRDYMCQYSKEYLSCLQRATDLCRNNTEFLTHNVPMAIASTENALRAVCDDVQGDSPATQVHDVTSAAQSLCSSDTIYAETEKCIRHIQNPPELMDIDGCRHHQMFVSCLDHILQNCPNAHGVYTELLKQGRETYDVLCADFKCPNEVADEEEDVVSYCMKEFYSVEPSAERYCRKLQQVPECIQEVSALCPPSRSPFRLDGALELINTVLENNCSP
ncbi:hypothetical protein BsWGS_00560 [Bradybaena similaris]